MEIISVSSTYPMCPSVVCLAPRPSPSQLLICFLYLQPCLRLLFHASLNTWSSLLGSLTENTFGALSLVQVPVLRRSVLWYGWWHPFCRLIRPWKDIWTVSSATMDTRYLLWTHFHSSQADKLVVQSLGLMVRLGLIFVNVPSLKKLPFSPSGWTILHSRQQMCEGTSFFTSTPIFWITIIGGRVRSGAALWF